MGAEDGTKARYAFVYGDFRRVHRLGLIACSYRAAEWRRKEIELTAVECSNTSTRRVSASEALIVHVRRRARPPPVGGDIDAMLDCGHLQT